MEVGSNGWECGCLNNGQRLEETQRMSLSLVGTEGKVAISPVHVFAPCSPQLLALQKMLVQETAKERAALICFREN